MKINALRGNKLFQISGVDIWNWYSNIFLELGSGYLDQNEREYIKSYYNEAGLLRTWRRHFFRRHYVDPFQRAAQFLLSDKECPLIVDLGCGTGTQSLAFAMLGARVIALDLDAQAIHILQKRKKFYEYQTGLFLDIQAHVANAFEFDFGQIGAIDGLYSLFAFNMMQPTAELLPQIAEHIAVKGRLAIQDGNKYSWLSQLPGRRRQVLSPPELNQRLQEFGFDQVSVTGCVSIPPILWSILPYDFLSSIDTALNKTWFWPISYLALYQLKDQDIV